MHSSAYNEETLTLMAGGATAAQADRFEYLCAKILGWQLGDPRPEALPPLADFIKDPRKAVEQAVAACPNYSFVLALHRERP